MRALAILAVALLAACNPGGGADVAMRRQSAADPALPPVPPRVARFGLTPAVAPDRGNLSIARDFLDLTFAMESGRTLPVLTRFEGPVTLRVTGAAPDKAQTDLDRVLARIRAEAGVPVDRVAAGPAAITVEFVPRGSLRAAYANVACFVIPGVSSWAEFRASRGAPGTDWTRLTTRARLAIFVPSDGAPQETRDCLHEELAQALGPLNDLYRLTDSVFNDDNFHSVLTGFDMLVLRVTYDPALRSGMTREQVAARLPAILARLNPGGERQANGPAPGPTPRAWVQAVETALDGRGRLAQRERAARQAIAMAQAAGWRDGRMALSYFALGRLILTQDRAAARGILQRAAALWQTQPGGAIQVAHVEMQIAVLDLAARDPARALARIDRVLPVVEQAENAALASTLLMMRSAALQALGRDAEARAARLDSRGWGRYGFGSDESVRARLSEIAQIAQAG